VPRRRIGRAELRDRLAVYFVADPEQTDRDFLAVVDDALSGGITSLQLRAKRMPGREMYDLAVILGERCRSAGTLFFVNDRVDIAVAADADGVHVGTRDLPLEATRRLVGRTMIVGFSPLAMADAITAKSGGADYVGLGPVFGTASKADAQPELGLFALAEQAAAAGLPSVGIGGIDVANAGAVIRAGVDGVAVISAIQGARRQYGEDRAIGARFANFQDGSNRSRVPPSRDSCRLLASPDDYLMARP
jgi:thiamine-phosphate pyrophosphorylase